MHEALQKGDDHKRKIHIIPIAMTSETTFLQYNGTHRRKISEAAYQHVPGAHFVYIDGSKGTGKSSVVTKILELVSQGKYTSEVSPFRESTHDPLAEEKRRYLREHGANASQDYVLRLLSAGRQSILERQLISNLTKENLVLIYNRSFVTTLAHQLEWIHNRFEAKNKVMTDEDIRTDLGRVLKTAERTFIKPNLAVILLCDPNTAYQRIINRASGGRDVESGLSQEHLRRMDLAYRAVSGGIPNSYIIDVTDVVEPCTTAQQIVTEMEKRRILKR